MTPSAPVIADTGARTPEEHLASLRAWFLRQATQSVEMVERRPPPGPGDDYVVDFEVVFEPQDLERCQVEIWLSGGSVGIGIERRSRIARRLGLKWGNDTFGAGFEPRAVDFSSVIDVCDAAARGAISFAWVSLMGRLIAIDGVHYDTDVPIPNLRSTRGYVPKPLALILGGRSGIVSCQPW